MYPSPNTHVHLQQRSVNGRPADSLANGVFVVEALRFAEMDLDANSMMASFLVSGVGFVAFVYGKKQSRYPQLLVGLILMIFPYFVPAVLPMLGIAVLLIAGLWFAVRQGW